MQSISIMVNLFGAVAMLLFGLAQVKNGVTRAFGVKLQAALAKGTDRGWRAFLSGFGSTLALQSSTATALLVASFVERRLIKPQMAQIALLGANLGTAVTAWIVATGVAWLSPLLLLCGMVLYRDKSDKRRGAGKALIGIGLMLLSLHLLELATDPVRASPALVAFMALLDDAWPVALILAAVLAFISSSSLAIIVLILSLADAGILPAGLIIVLVLGANLGGAIPPVVATLRSSPATRRITIGNLIMRSCGCLVVLPLADYGNAWLASLPLDPAKLPVDAHLTFNLLLALVAWPVTRPLTDLLARRIPDEPASDDAPRFLDPLELSTPIVALTSATREVLGVGDLIERMLLQVSDAFRRNDLGLLKEIPVLEHRVDRLQQEVKIYLSQLAPDDLEDKARRRAADIVDYAVNLEHIGDIIEKGLLDEVRKKVSLDLRFSEPGYRELQAFFDLTVENLRLAQTIFVTGDENLARRLMEVKVEVRRLEKQSAESHFRRLREGVVTSLQTSSLHLDMLRDLKRINAHLASVAHPIMDAGGLLAESRIRGQRGS